MKQAILALLVLIAPAAVAAQSYTTNVLTNATAPVTPVPVQIGKEQRPALGVCLGASCTGVTMNPECSLNGTNWVPMTVGAGTTITEAALATNQCRAFAIDPMCRWFQVRNPTVSSCTHSAHVVVDQ